MVFRSIVFCCASLLTAAPASEWTWRTTPLDTTTIRTGDQVTRVQVDWGTQGDHVERDPAEVRQQYDRFQAWITSPEVIAHLTRLKEQADGEERRQATEQASAWRRAYESAEQTVDLPVVDTQRTRVVAAPTWVRGIPWDVRQALMVAMIDARSPQQVAWATALRQSQPHCTIFALAWRSPKDLTRIQRENVTLGLLGVNATSTGKPSAEFAGDYLVSGLPAIVAFPDVDHLHIVEGLAP